MTLKTFRDDDDGYMASRPAEEYLKAKWDRGQ